MSMILYSLHSTQHNDRYSLLVGILYCFSTDYLLLNTMTDKVEHVGLLYCVSTDYLLLNTMTDKAEPVGL